MAKKKKRSKKQEQKDLSIVYEVKEPFSWDRFWDEKILATYKKFRQYLKERGILNFLISPFQYRNRLIGKLVIVALAILLGVVPRTINLINETKARNAASEIASIMNKVYTSNDITIQALASSQHDKKHILTFKITGDTKKGVPSTTDGYDVLLTPWRNNSDVEKVKYNYTIVPVDINTRILVVYVDNSEQNDKTGIFGLNIAVKDTPMMKQPIEIVLSDNQETNDLYKGGNVNLTILADKFGTTENTKQISTTKESLDKALNVYKINEERLKASNIKVKPTYDEVKQFVEKGLYRKDVEDNSLTTIVKSAPEAKVPIIARPKITLVVDGKEFTEEDYQNQTSKVSNQEMATTEIQTVMSELSDIINKLNGLNAYRHTKYKELYAMSRILNKEYNPTEFGELVNVKP